ncbi:ADYC domain-containing protein [Nannocystis pusilla]|uniref:ADYC domain-containing protein n=1 Tax=Nannocystis pusilla TaxID=889268 RepID=UPI003B82B1DA
MAFKTGVVSCAVVLALGCIGCDEAEEEFIGDDGILYARDAQWNDFKLNDFKLNDFKLNGARLNDFKLNGDAGSTDYIQLFDIEKPDGGYTLSSSVVGGMLKIGSMTEQDVLWSIYNFQVKDGGTTQWRHLYIRDVDQIPNTDVWEYDLDFATSYGYWSEFCTDEQGNPVKALALPDVWDPSTGNRVSPRPTGAVTFACKNAALAKCVLFGYRPWSTKNGVSLADYHQACTRMVRADYCGNGTPHTVSGTPIHVLDQLGIQTAAASTSYVVEAEWGPNGAVCLNPSNTRLANQTIGCNIPTCGASFASGGLIQSGKIVP